MADKKSMEYLLREIGRTDISKINEWRNDRDVIDFLGANFRYITKEVDESWYGAYLAGRLSAVRLAICKKESQAIVGAVYLVNIDWVNRSAEFAIWIGDKAEQGKGAGGFATANMLAHAFKDLNLHRIYLTVLASNGRAIGLYRKFGFIEEGRLRQAVYKNGEYVGLLQMSILSQEYFSCQGK